MVIKRHTILAFIILISVSAVAQENLVPLIKPEVPESQSLFKKTIWRRMDLMEKQNLPFFSKNSEISRILIDAVDAGLLTPYRTDSCINFMPDIIFNSNVSVEQADNPFVGGGFGFGGGFGEEEAEADESESEGPTLQRIPPDLFTVVYIKEDVIFDRNRSRMYWYIRSISIALPVSAGTTWNPAGFEKQIAHFRYEDVVEIFRGRYSETANWYNVQNTAQHVNFGDAFELRLFHAPIIKVANAENLNIREEYADLSETDPLIFLKMQRKYEYDLMDYESQLWEY